ncbi:aldo/keto reductase [Thioclava sp. BHET1]|nr:aldo/keto reductase [Thioclava sp. BHET1]
MILQEAYTLANGMQIPKIGLGTWRVENDRVVGAVARAIEIGYRHIDTAQAYGNEAGVGDGIRASGVARDEIFLTTKLAAEIKTYDGAAEAIDGSLRALGLDHIDLLLIHSPQPWAEFGSAERHAEGNREAWRAMEDALRAGKLRAIGVSNFRKEDLESLRAAATVAPMVDQVLAHIGNMPFDLIRACQARDMLVQAYSPIAHGELLKNPALIEMAAAYGVSVPQLSIRYVLQLDLQPLPKTTNPEHLATNADVDFTISDADMAVLSALPTIENYGEASAFPVFTVRN